MAKSIAFAADASPLASLLLSYIQAVCAFVAPRQPGASTASIDRLSHSRALRLSVVLAVLIPLVSSTTRWANADEPIKPSKALVDRCEKLSNEGNYASALDACERASELDPDPGLLAYIAQIQTALLHPVEAHDALERYLRSGELSPANRQL